MAQARLQLHGTHDAVIRAVIPRYETFLGRQKRNGFFFLTEAAALSQKKRRTPPSQPRASRACRASRKARNSSDCQLSLLRSSASARSSSPSLQPLARGLPLPLLLPCPLQRWRQVESLPSLLSRGARRGESAGSRPWLPTWLLISGVRSTTPEGSVGLSVRLTLLPVRRGPSAMAPDTSVWCFCFRPEADAAGAPMTPSLETCCRKLSLGGIASSTSNLGAGNCWRKESGGSRVEPPPLLSGMSVAEVRRSHRSWLLWMPEWARCTLIGVTVSGQG